MKDKIFITGISGFIGSMLKDRLLNLDYEVIGLVQEEKEATSKHKNIKYVRGDLTAYKVIRSILGYIKPHYIIHLAARTEVETSFYEPISFSEINYCGTVNLIESSKDLDNFKLFIMASTMETYGVQPKDNWKAFDENTKQYPNAPYSVAKIGCEYYLDYAKRAYGFPYTALRQTNSYGRIDNDFFVVEQIITQMLKNPNEINLGYREPYRNFLYIDDLLDLYIKLIKNVDLCRGEIFCTGPDNALQIEQLAYIIADKLNWHGKINWGTKKNRPGEIYYLNSTNSKAARVLGWHPKYSLSEGLDLTIKHWKDKLNNESD
jgi:nucleoside-diphosphate-sugar epimerase